MRFKQIKQGEVIPLGWLRDTMQQDVQHGYFFIFDEINTTVSHETFKHKNRVSTEKYNDLKCWWNAEHEAYWMDGVIRHGFLLQDEVLINRSLKWADDIIQHIDSSGYIGIYGINENGGRFQHDSENGELWTQSRVMIALLALYEFTADDKYLQAVERAVDLTVNQYQVKNPFESKKIQGGVSHGIGFFDVLEWLHRITGNKKYIDTGHLFYDHYNATTVRDDDLQLKKLLDDERKFAEHGPHIAEGLFIPQWLSSNHEGADHLAAAQNLIKKLQFHSTPSGAMRCDENVRGRKGGANEHYEFCSLIESLSSLNKMATLTADVSVADRMENISFNAAQGARMKDASAVAYLSSDNRLSIDHGRHGERETFDSCHNAAACCALNEGRLLPYFIDGLWYKTENENGLVANLFGPCRFTTTINNSNITITEKTRYPFEDEIVFHIQIDQPTVFDFYIRKPHGVLHAKYEMKPGMSFSEENNYIVITKKWNDGDSFKIAFEFPIKLNKIKDRPTGTSGHIIQRGPLIYARAIPANSKLIKRHNGTMYGQYQIDPMIAESPTYHIDNKSKLELMRDDKSDEKNPWINSPLKIRSTDSHSSMEFIPMGCTILRQVYFPLES